MINTSSKEDLYKVNADIVELALNADIAELAQYWASNFFSTFSSLNWSQDPRGYKIFGYGFQNRKV